MHAEPNEVALREAITLRQPLGPRETEELVGNDKVFLSLYDKTNGVHLEAKADDPYYVVGRKGAGKTAFLLGAALADEADVAVIKSKDVFSRMDDLRLDSAYGEPVADELAYVWEVVFFHAAMLAILRSDRQYQPASARANLWNYMKAFGDPDEIREDDLFAAVVFEVSNALRVRDGRSFRSKCLSIQPNGVPFADAIGWTREILAESGHGAIYVVVDNLEDLHRRLDDYAPVIIALFRVVGRRDTIDGKPLPFRLRFAFPAELLTRLSDLAANAGKDFRQRLTIYWTAHELMGLVGNRMRTFLDLHFPRAPRDLGLPARHDPNDSEAAHRTLRALLPPKVENGLGGVENADAYLMRHTQLLPRHLIIILNQVLASAVRGLDSDGVPQITPEQLVKGVADGEFQILTEVFSAYSYAHAEIKIGLEAIKNEIAVVEKASNLRSIYHKSGVAKSGGPDYTDFLRGCFEIGALGIVTERGRRYVEGVFSYTFVSDLRVVESADEVCVHPLFAQHLFDPHWVDRMAGEGHKAVYPYGSDPSHDRIQT